MNSEQSLTIPTESCFDRQQEILIKKAIVIIIQAMQTDYSSEFRKSQPDDDAILALKHRMYSLMKNVDPRALYDAYDKCVKAKPGFMPTVPELSGAAYAIDRAIRKGVEEIAKGEEAEKSQQKRIAGPERMPPNIREEWARITAQSGSRDIESIVSEHEKLIAKDMREKKIRAPAVMFDECAFGSCFDPGTMSHSVKGDGKFYCQKHFLMTA